MRRIWWVLLPFLAGCFQYVPVTGHVDRLKQGDEVRARFARNQTVQLGDLTVQSIVSMDAEFVRQDNSDAIFSAFWLDSSVREAGFPGDGWTVRIPLDQLSTLELKKLDWWRTGVTVAGVILGTYLGWEAIAGGPGGEGGGPGTGGQTR